MNTTAIVCICLSAFFSIVATSSLITFYASLENLSVAVCGTKFCLLNLLLMVSPQLLGIRKSLIVGKLSTSFVQLPYGSF